MYTHCKNETKDRGDGVIVTARSLETTTLIVHDRWAQCRERECLWFVVHGSGHVCVVRGG